MAKGPRTVPTLPDGIAAHWGLPPIADPRRLAGGYHNVVLRSGDVVVRVEVREAASVAWEHELLAWLAAEVPEVVAPLPAADGSTVLATGDRVVSVFPFVEGEPSTWPQTRERPGRPSYAGLDWECNDWWDSSLVPKPR